MRIQHNIMAMNAYRNYTNNVSAMKSNLEKLSSGYKINRAGDDAAGLAISEKMRAQITGLQTAQKNAKDGISLVQTAEGALTEVHDMLNRMVELATQSANGTYDNTTDRAQLQKEVDQLKSEINRIADSSNFNGIKLLDGSLAIQQAVDASSTSENKDFLIQGADRIIQSVIGQGEKAHEVVGEKTILDGSGAVATRAKFSVDLNTMNFEMGTYYAVTGGSTVNITISATKMVASNGVTKAVATNMTGTLTFATNVAGNYKVGDEIKAKASVNGVKVNVTVTIGTGGKILVSNFGSEGKKITTASSVSYTLFSVKATNAGKTATVATAKTVDIKNVFSVSINGTKLSGSVLGLASVTNAASTAAIASLVASSIASQNGVVDINGVKWTVTATAGKLTFTQVKIPESQDEARANFDVKFHIANVTAGADDDFKITLADEGTKTKGEGKVELSYSIKGGTVVETAGVAKDNSNKANTIFNIKAEDIQDGTKIAIGTRTLTLAIGPNSSVKDGMTEAVAGSNGYVELEVTDDLNTALNKISKALGSTVKLKILDKNGEEQEIEFQIGVSDSSMGYPTGLTVQRVNSVATDAKTMGDEKLAFDTLDKLAVNFKMKYNRVVTEETEAVEAKNGLTLQIGDTADEFNKLRVSIEDMHVDSLGLADINIKDQDSASAAIEAIKNAINQVSNVRGTLGATQNRLDHTINNLSVMTENIQDAESTIRDTDVADEMMAYTKNNILIQSAQAMLAQANQVPQGVLQLLQ